MLLYQIASWKTPANWARNLHRLIHTWGLSLMVTPTTVMCPVKFRSAVTTTPWPILHLSTWLRVIFRKTNAKFLCNGIPLHQGWGKELEAFWSLYKCVCPTHAVLWPTRTFGSYIAISLPWGRRKRAAQPSSPGDLVPATFAVQRSFLLEPLALLSFSRREICY